MEIPKTDEEVEKTFKENYSDGDTESLIGIYRGNREAGESIHNAYTETLLTYVVIERNLP